MEFSILQPNTKIVNELQSQTDLLHKLSKKKKIESLKKIRNTFIINIIFMSGLLIQNKNFKGVQHLEKWKEKIKMLANLQTNINTITA